MALDGSDPTISRRSAFVQATARRSTLLATLALVLALALAGAGCGGDDEGEVDLPEAGTTPERAVTEPEDEGETTPPAEEDEEEAPDPASEPEEPEGEPTGARQGCPGTWGFDGSPGGQFFGGLTVTGMECDEAADLMPEASREAGERSEGSYPISGGFRCNASLYEREGFDPADQVVGQRVRCGDGSGQFSFQGMS